MNLRDYLQKTDQQKIALGHFNVSTIEVFNSIIKISAKLDLPVRFRNGKTSCFK